MKSQLIIFLFCSSVTNNRAQEVSFLESLPEMNDTTSSDSDPLQFNSTESTLPTLILPEADIKMKSDNESDELIADLEQYLDDLTDETLNRIDSKLPDAPEESCKNDGEIEDSANKLHRIRNTLLESLNCGQENCSRIIIYSSGPAAIRHPARFGMYTLSTTYEEYPVYVRQSSGQFLFYQKEFEKWIYAHRIERWIVGPKIGDSSGGLTLLSREKCPWKINSDSGMEAFYFDQLEPNRWTSRGNGWKLDDSIAIKCFEGSFDANCRCSAYNVTGNKGGKLAELHSHLFGIYKRIRSKEFLAPLYEKENNSAFLYSHHHEGRVWLIGTSLTSWSLRLDLTEAKMIPNQNIFCPNNLQWEYLTDIQGQREKWEKAQTELVVSCVDE